MARPLPIWRRLERQAACRALSRAWAKTGKRIAARMAIIAITTSSSIKVKPRCGSDRCDDMAASSAPRFEERELYPASATRERRVGGAGGKRNQPPTRQGGGP